MSQGCRSFEVAVFGRLFWPEILSFRALSVVKLRACRPGDSSQLLCFQRGKDEFLETTVKVGLAVESLWVQGRGFRVLGY